MKKLTLLLLLGILCSFKPGKKHENLRAYAHFEINFQTPSDICLTTANPTHYYIVSNRGSIAETDSNGKVLRHTKYDGSDYQACCVKDNMLYAIDQSSRRVDIINESDLKVIKSIWLHYSGDRAKAFRGLAYLPSEKKFIATIESPARIYEYDEKFNFLGEARFNGSNQVSSVTYHDNFLWFMSGSSGKIMKANPSDYSVIKSWTVPVLDAQGICFDTDGNMLIISGAMGILFKYKKDKLN